MKVIKFKWLTMDWINHVLYGISWQPKREKWYLLAWKCCGFVLKDTIWIYNKVVHISYCTLHHFHSWSFKKLSRQSRCVDHQKDATNHLRHFYINTLLLLGNSPPWKLPSSRISCVFQTAVSLMEIHQDGP